MLIFIVFTFFLIVIWKILDQRKSFLEEGILFLEEGVLFLNKNGKVISCNPAFCKILEVAAEDFKGCDFFDKVAKDKQELLEQCQQLLQRVEVEGSELRETFFYKKEGGSVAVNIFVSRCKNKRRLLVLKDTDQEKREFSLGKEFIANASHELRTPITIIKGFVETLQDLPEVSDAMLEDIFDKILRSCTRMDDIVKNLLILTDLDHLFSIKKTIFDVISLLDNTRHLLLEMYPTTHVEVVSAYRKAEMEGDIALLELAIMNLLQNAVKYSPSPAKIQLTFDLLEKETVISIIDQGVGISKENVPHIFNRFYSVDKTISRRLGGAGLGLSIVKNIIDKHQGTIAVENNPIGGTIFTIHLPSKI